ncbi:MAG: muconate cycloisomerase [Bryobacteraceae bacterium]|nr:MAG: muconate cycloisomerase [Bryobacteraceae bacterium]
MKRRTFLSTSVLAGAPLSAGAPDAKPSLETRIRRLNLRHTWTTVMSSSEYRDTFFVAYSRDGITGIGEGAPIIRYKESAETNRQAIESIRPWLLEQKPEAFVPLMDAVFRRVQGQFAAKAALDIALLDWNAQKLGVPLWRMFGLDPAAAPLTTFSIGIDKAEVIRQKVREAEEFPVLKIKVGLDNDEEVIAAVRSVTKKPLRVDANEGFKSKEEAVEKINWLEKQGVEFIEQPLPAANLEDMNWIRKRVHIPVIADEACLHPADVPRLAPYFDGVNVKVDKCGGLLEAKRMIEMARSLGLKVMLGCMVSSSAAITAAAHLSPLADYADLDGHLLIANDPYEGVRVEKGRLILPQRPGLGLRPRRA